MRQIVVSYSEITDARRCPLKHELAWVEGWKKTLPPDDPRSIGLAWHRVMAAYYTALKESVGHPWQLAKAQIDLEDESIRDRLNWMLDGYWEQYSFEQDYTVLAVELPFEITLPWVEEDLTVVLKGVIDLLVKDRYGVWVDDHKSVDSLPWKKRDPVDDQLPLMCFAANALEIAGPRHSVVGARYSYTRRKPLANRELRMSERYFRRLVNVPAQTALRAAINAQRTALSRYHESVRLHELRRLGGSSMLTTPPTNRRATCQKDCDFEQPCTSATQGLNLRQQLDARGFYQWRQDLKEPQRRED